MTPLTLMILLFLAGASLLVAEMFLPAQGVLGVLGGAAILGAIGIGFWINQWLGVSLTLAVLVASPFVANLAIHVWQKTPYGRRVILNPEESRLVAPRVVPGQTGKTLSELRPAGEIELSDGTRLEARSERGIIRAGSAVNVVGYIDGCIIVRENTV